MNDIDVSRKWRIQELTGPVKELQDKLRHYNMTAWRCSSLAGEDEVTVLFLLYSPSIKKIMKKKFPLLLFFGGTGELGEKERDLVRLFNARTLFDKITSEAFQNEHPCYLFAPLIKNASEFRCANPEDPSVPVGHLKDVLFAVIKRLGKDAVDTNRLYTTGLSFGGCAAFEMVSSYPELFAATIPVAATESDYMVPKSHKINVWWVENSLEQSSEWVAFWKRFRLKVEANGGEFRFSSFPSHKHNAWDDAWQEPGLWEWLFSKTNDGKSTFRSSNIVRKPGKEVLSPDFSSIICTSSRESIDAEHVAKYGADNLERTYFKATDSVVGDWWKVELSEGWSGVVEVRTGDDVGQHMLPQGVLEASSDGKIWCRIGQVSRRTGVAKGRMKEKHRFVRLRLTSPKTKIFTVRELMFHAN